MDSIEIFLGRFHPLIVHLPIGILVLAFLMEIASRKEKFQHLNIAIPFALLIGSGGAVVAAILGYLLSWSGDYDAIMLWWHQWLGIGTAGFGFICYFIKTKWSKGMTLLSQSLLMILLAAAGHQGGNLTHGATYLTEYAPWTKKKEKIPIPSTIDSVLVFQHLIEPILIKKCVSCHNSGKRKGELLMTTPEDLLKGGKHGAILVAGQKEASELYHRVTLAPDAEDFMPPDGKTPLTGEEIDLIGWWIDATENTFEKRVGEFEVSKAIYGLIGSSLQLSKSNAEDAVSNLPDVPVEVIEGLVESGFVVRSLQGNYQLLDITLKDLPPNTDGTIRDRLAMLEPIHSRIIWLNLSGQGVKDEDLKVIGGMENIQRLKLNDNPITDTGISFLSPLKKLESLNLYETEISEKALPILASLPELRKIYLWKTGIKETEISNFLEQNPQIQTVFGALE